MEKKQSKIPLWESIILMSYVILLDIIGLILVCFLLDDFFILDILTFPVTQIYFRIKGVKSTYDLTASTLELIPYVGALPIKSIGVAITIWMANHPKAAEITKVAAGKVKGTIEVTEKAA